MNKKIIPLEDRVIIKRLKEKEETDGGIIIPEVAKEKTQFGEVIAAGPGKITDAGSIKPLSVKTGDKVLFGKYSGTEIIFEGQELLIIKEDEILGIIND